MKLCITAAGKSIDSNIDTRFGRAPWFLIVDTDTGTIIEAVENSAVAQGQGAGIAATRLVSDKNVDAVLTGTVGPNAALVFQGTQVRMFEGASSQDTVAQALAKFKQGVYGQVQTGTPTAAPQEQGVRRGRGWLAVVAAWAVAEARAWAAEAARAEVWVGVAEDDAGKHDKSGSLR